MKLTIIRHGETVENAQGIIMGQQGGHLNERGMAQAKEVAEKLKDENFDQVWASDLQRCIDTAKYILQLHPDLKLQTTPDLREVNYGEFQGRPSSEIQPFFKQIPDFLTTPMPEGESHLDMFKRTINFINRLYRDHPNQNVLLVTHTGPIEAIRASVEKASKDNLFPKDALHASIWRLAIDHALETYPKI